MAVGKRGGGGGVVVGEREGKYIFRQENDKTTIIREKKSSQGNKCTLRFSSYTPAFYVQNKIKLRE